MNNQRFRCYLVTQQGDKQLHGQVVERMLDDLPLGDVLVRVEYSGLNYKDALSASGHPGVTRRWPHVPGIDAAGSIVESQAPKLLPGRKVLVTGYDLGQNTWGGYAEYIRVPGDWVLPLPDGLSARDAMIYGTAGLTAALCLDALEKHNIAPDAGEVVVTGASGGVGSLAVAMLARLGYKVAAVSGKPQAHQFLRELGASSILGREEVYEAGPKPLLAERWAGAVDTVGGTTLATLVRSARYRSCVTACGLVGGDALSLSVYPFILRGVTLVGIDSVECPRALRERLWSKLAESWRPAQLEAIAREEIGLDELSDALERIKRGETIGRVLVKL